MNNHQMHWQETNFIRHIASLSNFIIGHMQFSTYIIVTSNESIALNGQIPERSITSEYTKAWYKCSVSLRYQDMWKREKQKSLPPKNSFFNLILEYQQCGQDRVCSSQIQMKALHKRISSLSIISKDWTISSAFHDTFQKQGRIKQHKSDEKKLRIEQRNLSSGARCL